LEGERIGMKCPRCEFLSYVFIAVHTGATQACLSCGKLVLTSIGVVWDGKGSDGKGSSVRNIYSYSPEISYSHCVNHPEIMFNQSECPMCNLERDLSQRI